MNINVTAAEMSLIKDALLDQQNALVGKGERFNSIVGVINKLSPGVPKVKKVVALKEYIFSFEGGGWNTVWAKTKRGAIKAALKEYDNNPESSLSVRVSSVSKATRKGLQTACNTFY